MNNESKSRCLWYIFCASAAVLLFTGCGEGTTVNALVNACRRDDTNAITTLLKAGVNINGIETKMLSQTPLVAVAATPATNAFYLLLKRGADVNAPTEDGTTPLMEAVMPGDYNMDRVQELIRRGANVNAADNASNSVLKCARAAGCKTTVDVLIVAGAKE